MKWHKKLIISIFVLFFYSVTSYAQSAAIAAASATVVTPISLMKNSDMNFGNVAVSAATGGTVLLTTSGTRTTGGSGGVTLPSTTGSVAAAQFTVSGAPGFTYSVSLPASCTLADGGGHTMAVNSFVSSPSATGTLGSAGTQVLKVSATMAVAAAQPAGAYTNSSAVPVTVNYN